MGIEIERKYLVKDNFRDYINLDSYKSVDIKQSYLSTDPEIRIRQKDDTCYHTRKSQGVMTREEYEVEITKECFDNLLLKIDDNMINKKRYSIPIKNNLIAELDIYEDNLEELITVEVEFPNEEVTNEFIPPIWFGKEVTYDSSYKNSSLAYLDFRKEITWESALKYIAEGKSVKWVGDGISYYYGDSTLLDYYDITLRVKKQLTSGKWYLIK